MRLSVWAPEADSVELVLPTRRVSLAPVEGGYWRIDVAEADLEAGYRYSISGSTPLPDPRSRWQPDGVHWASFLSGIGAIEAAQIPAPFRAKPLEQAVLYELHMGTFTPEGTYAAARNKLRYLVDLGVTHLELMPLASFPGRRGWGYDGVDLYAPFPAYGAPQDLVDFVADCHRHGLAVLLDVVYNHLGPDGNYLAQFAPYFTDRYETVWGAAINFDGPHSDGVRRFVIDNALMWLRDYGFDGLRLDAVHAIFSFGATHVLEELAIAVKGLARETNRPLILIAESDLNDPRLIRDSASGGYGLDAQWVDDFHHALHRQFTGETDGYYADFAGLEDVATALRDGYVYQGRYSVHRKRRHGRPPAGVAASQLVVSAQNHDQIGNRAQGERLSMMLNLPQLKAVAALTLLSPFVPLLFQGEEWGAGTPFLYFTDHESAELGALIAEGRTREFQAFQWKGTVPDPQDLDTFVRSKLNWAERSLPPHAELLAWYRQLIRLRGDKVIHPEQSPLKSAKAVVNFDTKAGWLSFCHNGVLAVFNLSARAQRVPLPGGDWELVIRSDDTDGPSDPMPPHATFIHIGGDDCPRRLKERSYGKRSAGRS